MCSVIPVDAHTLPGLCHSAAVAAAALRAPAQPQLLLRLTPIKVVCEFPKTRHLPSDCSPAGLEAFLYFNLLGGKKKLYCWFGSATLQNKPLDFYRGSGVSRQSESAHELAFLWCAAPVVQKNNPSKRSAVVVFFFSLRGSSDQPGRRIYTHTYVHIDSLEIVTLGTAYQSTQR